MSYNCFRFSPVATEYLSRGPLVGCITWLALFTLTDHARHIRLLAFIYYFRTSRAALIASHPVRTRQRGIPRGIVSSPDMELHRAHLGRHDALERRHSETSLPRAQNMVCGVAQDNSMYS